MFEAMNQKNKSMVEAMDCVDNAEQRPMQQVSSTNLHPTFEILATHKQENSKKIKTWLMFYPIST